ncbi:phosphotransferase family protein [Parahaliea aestuarii]|uniref:Phosphotransferase family protein n=1 Tax=Parahaliea aestuarii TaxID=1852021 RepID=A0A5C8ZRK0_9GAMM|nr:phosphotransferase family protein [Parahaliea aestuarii]TXS89981.1 phosphotransferase family protein [Parahaliea aestuarii]
MDKTTVQERLGTALSRSVSEDFRVDGLRLLTGGSAAQTWRFTLHRDSGAEDFILRLAHGGEPFEMGIDKRMEAAVQSHAVAHGVLAPDIILVIEPEDQLGEGFVMKLVEGETIPQKILRQERFANARPRMAAQSGRLLADIHRVPVAELDFLPDLSVAPQLAALERFYASFGEPVPLFDFTFRWLQRRMPAAARKTLVHADFRNGNLMVDESGIVSILDWELAHLGDPMEDLGWLCVNSWRFGNRELPVGGFGSREDLYRGYREAGGELDEDAVFFWEVLGVLKWGLICLYQTGVHLKGIDRSVNRAAIGRRVSETEIDLLSLLSDPRAR